MSNTIPIETNVFIKEHIEITDYKGNKCDLPIYKGTKHQGKWNSPVTLHNPYVSNKVNFYNIYLKGNCSFRKYTGK